VRMESLKILRSKNRYEQKLEDFGQLPSLQPIPDSPYSEVEALEVEKALEELPSEQKEVLVLKNFNQLTFQEIAQITESSPDTVASRYRYGLQKLSHKFKKSSFSSMEVE
ncbi:MAG: sigma-70 family RNA polymerase sigma factor, partial [Planctomycetota bacterium]